MSESAGGGSASGARAGDEGLRLHGWGLAILLGFTLVAVVGYGVFALHPERLPASAVFATVYRMSFQAFAQLHIGLSAAVLCAALLRAAGLRWLPAFGLVYLVSFLAEFVGTGYGVPFGGYGYSGLLGMKIGDRVPALIPLSWFVMAIPAYALARTALPDDARRVARVTVAALLLVTWDLSLDPAMSHLTSYWIWEEPGPFYGMPLENLAGWLITGLLVMGALEATGAARWTAGLGARWSAGFYGAVLLMPLGMCVAAGLWDVPALTAVAMGGTGLLTLVLRRRTSRAPVPEPDVRMGPTEPASGGATLSGVSG